MTVVLYCHVFECLRGCSLPCRFQDYKERLKAELYYMHMNPRADKPVSAAV